MRIWKCPFVMVKILTFGVKLNIIEIKYDIPIEDSLRKDVAEKSIEENKFYKYPKNSIRYKISNLSYKISTWGSNDLW